MRGGKTTTYPAFPEIEADIGYNPARYLAHPIDAEPVIGKTPPFATTWAVIHGLQEVHTIRQWFTIEAELDRGENGGPRQRVIKQLNDRKRQIERDDAPEAPSQAEEPTAHTAPSEADDNTTPEAATESDDDAREPTDQSPPASAATTTSTETAVATDGGAEPPADPICPVCGEDLIEDEVAGNRCHWCPTCTDFRDPATPPSPEPTEDEESTTTADTAAKLPEIPRCPDCRGELTREEAGDEVAYWCSPCGGFKEPLDAATMEATA